jgi:hypothetical protein
VTLEPGSAGALALGVLHFGLLAAIALAVGWGGLALLRYPTDPLRRWLLAPFAATALWALAGNLAVRLGLTLAQAAPGIAVASLALGLLGVYALRRGRGPRPPALVLGLGLVAGLLVWPYVVRGLTAHLGGWNLDTFHYTSTAAVLWRYGLESASAPLPFFQRYAPYADALGPARNHAFVLLALLSPVVQPGEPLFVRNLFVGWSVFVLACSLALYRVAWGGPDGRAEASPLEIFAYVVLTAGVGWALVPALVGNWDNALLVSVGPVLAALAREPAGRPGYGVLLGATVAYALYSYTELAPLLGLLVLPLYLRTLASGSLRRPLLAAYALAAVSAAVLLAPGLGPLWAYLRHQVLASRVPEGLRPGGLYAVGLVSRSGDLSAWWALGAEQGFPADQAWAGACAWLLTGLVLLGALRLVRRGHWGEVGSLALMSAGLAYFVGVQRYGYAGYKVLSIGWWLVGHCLVEGWSGVLAAVRAGSSAWLARARTVALGGALGAALVGCLVVAERQRFRVFFPEAVFRSQPTPAALVRLRVAAGGQPPMDVLVDRQLNDYVTLPWVYYALKDTSLRAYHAAPMPVPGGAEWPPDGPVPTAALLRAGERPGAGHRFRTPEFDLVDLESIAIIARIDSPNQLEAWGTWLGTRPMAITLLGRRQLPVTLSFEAAPGPSRPETPHRTLVVRAGPRELSRIEIEGPTRVAVPLVIDGGREVLTLSTPDTPSVAVLANGDTRPLLVSVRNLTIEPGAPGR